LIEKLLNYNSALHVVQGWLIIAVLIQIWDTCLTVWLPCPQRLRNRWMDKLEDDEFWTILSSPVCIRRINSAILKVPDATLSC
jgi:hypothetical protein